MVNITIRPAAWHAGGFLKAEGHAGKREDGGGVDPVCAACTALFEGLAVNLHDMAGIAVMRRAKSGLYDLRWTKEYHGSTPQSLHAANSAAWNFYKALDALSRTYPDAVRVRWDKAEYMKPGKGRPKR